MWNHWGLFGWTVEKVISVGIVASLVKLYVWLTEKWFHMMSHYWVVFVVSCLNLFLIGAILQEWYFLDWIWFAPNTITFMTRGYNVSDLVKEKVDSEMLILPLCHLPVNPLSLLLCR